MVETRIESKSYTYKGDNICEVSAVLNIYAEEGGGVLLSRGISAEGNITDDDFTAKLQAQLQEQIQSYLAKMAFLDDRRKQLFPESTSFNDAVEAIFAPIQNALQ